MSVTPVILFDYDGVITHKVDFAAEVATKHGVDGALLQAFFSEHLHSCLIGSKELLLLLDRQRLAIGWPHSVKELFDALYLETQRQNVPLAKYVERIRKALPCYVATNQEKLRLSYIRSDPFVRSHFRGVFCSCEVGAAKPDTRFFAAIFERLRAGRNDLSKKEVLFTDDLAENVDAAERFGFEAHLYDGQDDFENFVSRRLDGTKFPTVRGDRCLLTKMRYEHAQGYSDILSEPSTYAYLTESGPVSKTAALAKIRRNRSAFDPARSIYWSITDRQDQFLGFVALHNFQTAAVAISFGVHPRHRRKKVATRVLQAVLGWKGLRDRTVEMATHLDNIASFALLTRLTLPYMGILSTPFGKRHVFRGKVSPR